MGKSELVTIHNLQNPCAPSIHNSYHKGEGKIHLATLDHRGKSLLLDF